MPSYKELNIHYQGGNLYIPPNQVTDSLKGCPEVITGSFDCSRNCISSLVGGPQKVDGDYYCIQNQLTDLIGCASHIGGKLNIVNNLIRSLIGVHKIIKSCSHIWFDEDLIDDGGIGLLLIDNLSKINSFTNPFNIISSYFGTGTKGMMACRAELIAKGYPNHAKL